ncbi:Satratoxin biosynthesis SC2 cluster protein [Paramyrothecium foliicola]|nr:Satratoxin biosynthesis SC2 cluster protein [Paramyrothecium foliicola]
MAGNGGTRLIASCWSLAVTSGILMALRIYCKVWRSRGLWYDDHLLMASWVSLAIAVSINTYIVTLGFGNHIWTISDENLRTINLNTIMVACFGLMSTTLSKTSFSLTLYRIARHEWMKYILIFIIVTINISLNLIWIFGLAKCTPFAKVLDSKVPGTCWDRKKLLKFQLFATYYSAALDFVLALLPWQILMGLKLRRRERLGVTIAMSLGAIAGATAIVKAVLAVSMSSPDFTYARVDLTIWTLAEPAVSIMAISIPVLRMLYRELKSTSNRSYFRNKSNDNAVERGTGSKVTDPTSDFRKSQKYGQYARYGQNSVVIMSTTNWQDSREALKDPETSQGASTPPRVHGVLKTEEVQVNFESVSSMSEQDSFELAPLPGTYQMGVDKKSMERKR